MHRVYDLAQTPLQRLLASGVLSVERKWELNALAEQLDPLVLSEQLDILRHALLRLADVDRLCGTVTVRGRKENARILPLSADGQRVVCAYLDAFGTVIVVDIALLLLLRS